MQHVKKAADALKRGKYRQWVCGIASAQLIICYMYVLCTMYSVLICSDTFETDICVGGALSTYMYNENGTGGIKWIPPSPTRVPVSLEFQRCVKQTRLDSMLKCVSSS